MDSDEDEDIIFEGSQLHAHLLNSEYSGPEISYYNSGKENLSHTLDCANKCEVRENIFKGSWKSFVHAVGLRLKPTIDCHHEEEFKWKIIHNILDNSLVTIEDSDFLCNMFDAQFTENPYVYRTGGSFGLTAVGGVALSVALLSTPVLPWILRVPSLLFAGWNVLRALNWKIDDRKGQQLTLVAERLHSTLSSLQTLCSTIVKSMQFVQEMELTDRGFTLPNLVTHLSVKTLPNQPSALLCLPLRQELLDTLGQLQQLARMYTLRIRDRVPLSSAVDNASHYLACQAEPALLPSHPAGADQPVTLQTIRASTRQCHLQVSEMLRRLALCFLLPPSDSGIVQLIEEFNQTLPSHTCVMTERLRTAYDYFAAWKVGESTNAADIVPDGSAGGLSLALRSLWTHLRATALIVESASDDCESLLLPSKRVQLSHECKAVATCWELVDLEILKRSAGPKTAAGTESRRAVAVEPPAPSECHRPQPLDGAWEPDVEDLEILELDIGDEPSVGRTEDDDEFLLRETREERLARKRELAAQSKRLYSELQVVLKSKADEWREREARVMERLGKTPSEVTAERRSSSPDQGTVRGVPERVPDLDTAKDVVGNAPEVPCPRFDPTSADMTKSTFSVQASLAAQVRAMASQRTAAQLEDLIGDSEDSDEIASTTSQDP